MVGTRAGLAKELNMFLLNYIVLKLETLQPVLCELKELNVSEQDLM